MIVSDYTADEMSVATDEGITDPEFDQETSQVCWQDLGGRLWVAPMDPVTGDILLDQKQGLDTGLAPIGSPDGNGGTGNGPEWIRSDSGSDILYTKAITSDPASWQVWSASWDGSTWQVRSITTGSSPNGSTVTGDPDPKFIYRKAGISGGYDLYWRDYKSGVEGLITTDTTKGVRWVNQESSQLVYSQQVDGIGQIFRYDVSLGISTQLTFGGSDKTKPWMWKAPELNGGLVLMANETNPGQPDTLGLYTETSGAWNRSIVLRPPTGRQLIYSAEPVVYDGRSGISFVAKDEISPAAQSEVWMAGFGQSGPVYRQVSESNPLSRNDPETFATDQGLFVYYNIRSVKPFDTTPPSLYRSAVGVIADTGMISSASADHQILSADNGTDVVTGQPSNEQSSAQTNPFYLDLYGMNGTAPPSPSSPTGGTFEVANSGVDTGSDVWYISSSSSESTGLILMTMPGSTETPSAPSGSQDAALNPWLLPAPGDPAVPAVS